jgi:DNA repair protein RecO (recombination protein O)
MPDPGRARLEAQAGYVLHQYPYRETSLLVDAFTQNFGRVALVARGARRPRSALRGVLLAFQPLLLSWGGKADLRTLHRAEWQGGLPLLQGKALLCGFYLNELLVKLLPRDDGHEALYAAYAHALQALGNGEDHAATLRRFEKQLLRELGYALALDRDADSGELIEPDGVYRYLIERGPVRNSHRGSAAGHTDRGFSGVTVGENRLELSGTTLLDIQRDEYSDPLTLQQSKALMRMLINHYLGNQTLNTRQILKDLQQL